MSEFGFDNVRLFWYTCYYNNNERRSKMNLDEFKAYVIATRQASKAEALSVLSATMSVSTTKESETK
jgi:hypothetical protein